VSNRNTRTRNPEVFALGNQASLRRLQAKLTIGAVNDPLEHEADAVAERVKRMQEPGQVSRDAKPRINRKCAECESEEKLQPKVADGTVDESEAPATVDAALRSPAQPLNPASRAFFEPRFGTDFSDVRIHSGEAAARSARDVGARAYTVGRNVVFGEGQYQPHADGGRRLLAHELVHTVQQGAVRSSTAMSRKAIIGASGLAITTGTETAVSRSPECPYSYSACKGQSCVPKGGKGTGFCGWGAGCQCFRRDQPMLNALQQVLFNLIIAALIAAGFVIAEAAIAAIVACLSGPCEAAALIAALGAAAAAIVMSFIGKKDKGAAAGAGPTAAASEGAAAAPPESTGA